MLSYLKISNLAILDDVSLEPGPGLNVLTGETGAGKSIIVDALGLVLGERGATHLIRGGAERLAVEAQFDLEGDPAAALLRQAGLDDPGGQAGEIIIRRELLASGRGRAWINGSIVGQSTLRRLGEILADLHGQHQHQSLLGEPGQRDALDRFAAVRDLRQEVSGACREFVTIKRELEELSTSEREKGAQRSWLHQQVTEIENVGPAAGEEERLAHEESMLRNSEEIARLADESCSILNESDDSVLAGLAAARERLTRLVEIDPRVQEGMQLLEQAEIAASEVANILARYRDRDDLDPRRLEAVAARLALLQGLKKKYGGTLEAVAAHLEWARGELSAMEEATSRLGELPDKAQRARELYDGLAKRLSDRRRRAARRLERELSAELASLAMEGARVEVALGSTSGAEPQSHGLDSVEFLLAPNRGEDARPLGKIASGGELSRVMLALRNITSSGADRRTLVFDEVDSGIGGRVAEVVGTRLGALARTHQILCITHLPQIASVADQHFRVTKHGESGRTRARVDLLKGKERVDEIARMLGGSPPQTARRHAAAMMSRRSRATT